MLPTSQAFIAPTQNTGWSLEIARDINEAGQIMGCGISLTGQTRAFLLDPVPIPGRYGYSAQVCQV